MVIIVEAAPAETSDLDAIAVPLEVPLARPPRSRGQHSRPRGRLITHLQQNHMVRNSMYMLLSSGLQAGLGFAFWILAARLFSAPQVGRATSLIAATTLIGFIALLGLNSTLVRYLPRSKHKNTMITVALLLVASFGGVLALGYALAIPAIAPQLSFLEHRALFVIGFVVLSALAAVNLVTDAVFIACRRSGLVAFVDGGVGGVAKVLLVPLLAGSGAYGLFCASAGGFAAAAVASLILIWTTLHHRPEVKGAVSAMKPLLRFSAANYLGNVFSLVPTLVVPLIVLDRLGASRAAYYFVAFQVANLLYAGIYAVEQNFLAEGGHGEEDLPHLMRRSAKVLSILVVPACVVVVALAHPLMSLFGVSYASNGSSVLVVMALAALPIAAQNWLITVLRLSGQLVAVTVCNAIYAVAICGLAWALAGHGLTALGASWLIGGGVGLVAAAAAVLFGARRGTLNGAVPS
jgi:O-antigen/teichoic acid export membrane protein